MYYTLHVQLLPHTVQIPISVRLQCPCIHGYIWVEFHIETLL